ncbi:ferredoxin--NADP reductase [Xanthobacter dioxanivorans]|uniref:ferredoxin--NADP(+) reductase n=1 Tax=Xanthobacter dioxanivorans TaxID=2528964 RepID=A0A974PRD7_9HYPH|nr:ferredoxin--NADP reductase [Xanthobacter dioxanivorans]QRG08339.1 ferredoxin--NADP reductase [Xanthobacter dioxanivorans]
MSNLNTETVLDVRHWTDRLFSFTATRDTAFRFKSGQFTMIGLPVADRPLLRAYSLACAPHEDTLEFFSIKVPDGPLTSRLQALKPGDPILVGRRPTGTLLLDNLKPGKRLYLLATGTGLAPFVSIAKDPEAYERFEHIVLVHGCREVAELAYGEQVVADLKANDFLGEYAAAQLLHYPTVTREPFRNRGRVTDLMESGRLFADLGLPDLDPAHDRVMLCGSPQMIADTRELLEGRGFAEGAGHRPETFVVEKAFAER